jgi:hypothetical protein
LVYKISCFVCAILAFLSPINAFVFSAAKIAATSHSDLETGASVLGAGIGSMILGFFAFFLGIIFLILGFVIKGKKKV